MKKIDSTNFIQPVTLTRRTVSKDSFGQVKTEFKTVRKLFGELIPVNIGEQIKNKVLNYSEIYTLNTWYASDITSSDQIIYNGENYNITSIVPLDNKTFMSIKIVKIYD
jgi:SPP1 family predicted phage head-tail adaptor